MHSDPGSVSFAAALHMRQKGLTLVELLVAIGVLALIAVLGWRGLDSILRTRLSLTGDLNQTRGMQLAFAQLQNDCSHIAGNLPGRPTLQVSDGRITLVRSVTVYNQPTRLQVVAYRVKNGVLTRSASAETRDLGELDMLWKAVNSDLDESQPVVLQSSVAGMKMRLWSNNSWQTEPASAVASAPAGMEVALQLQGREGSLLKIFLLGAG